MEEEQAPSWFELTIMQLKEEQERQRQLDRQLRRQLDRLLLQIFLWGPGVLWPPRVHAPSMMAQGRHADSASSSSAHSAVQRYALATALPHHRAAANRLDADYYDLEVGRQGDRGAHLFPVVVAVTSSAGGAGRTGGGVTAPVPEPSAASALEGVMVQAYGAFLPGCVTVYPVLKDAPDYVKFTIFGGLASITVALFAGILCRTVAHRRLAMQLVSFLAISVLTFSVASQLSSPTFIALTAFVGVMVNLIIMLLRF